jgi:hypothetical protein
MVVAGPLDELELADELRLQPLAFRHLRFRQPLAPTTAPRLRQIRKRALVDLESLEVLEQLRTREGCEAVAGSRDVDQLIALEVPKDQRIERLRSARVATDHELLPAIDAHLHPRTGSQTRFVCAVAPLRDESLEAVHLHGFNQDRQSCGQRSRVPDRLPQLRSPPRNTVTPEPPDVSALNPKTSCARNTGGVCQDLVGLHMNDEKHLSLGKNVPASQPATPLSSATMDFDFSFPRPAAI